jgi:hypothetical protein
VYFKEYRIICANCQQHSGVKYSAQHPNNEPASVDNWLTNQASVKWEQLNHLLSYERYLALYVVSNGKLERSGSSYSKIENGE